MDKTTNNATMPTLNQILKESALTHLLECGLPESLIEGIDCSTIEAMEQSLVSMKDCYYSSVRKHIETTYGEKNKDPIKVLQQMEYDEKDYWEMFETMNFTVEENKYIANFYHVMSEVMSLGTKEKMGEELQRLLKKESLLERIIEGGIDIGIEAGIKVGIDKELMNKFKDYLELQGDIRVETEKEAFICGFRSAYHLLEECRSS